jgi:hypothetical protein
LIPSKHDAEKVTFEPERKRLRISKVFGRKRKQGRDMNRYFGILKERAARF